MAERQEAGDLNVDRAPSDAVNADGSAARASTRDGVLEHDDVANSPLQQGTDPLGDRAIARRSGRPSMQAAFFGVLALLFAYFFVSDVVHGEWLKALLGAFVLVICGFAISRELRRPRRG